MLQEGRSLQALQQYGLRSSFSHTVGLKFGQTDSHLLQRQQCLRIFLFVQSLSGQRFD